MRFLCTILVLALVTVLLTGCDDPEARNNAAEARKVADALQAKVTKMESELAETTKKVDTLREALGQQIAGKLDPIANSMTDLEKKLRDEVIKNNTDTMAAMRKELETARTDFDGRIKDAITVTVAEELNKLRGDLKKQRDELMGFMDNQLKELYPYAYQPHRFEKGTPPEAPK
jgi:DNA repair exonuclease SbcCD ATPase subunit